MAGEPERFSLSRWSRRKLDAKRAPADAPEAPPPVEATPSTAPMAEAVAPLPAVGPEATPIAADAPALPPVESLSIDSDFRPFLAPKVDEATRRAALRKLFSDPHFNVMDGLDVYIDDYNKPDPMPADMLAKIVGVYERLTEESAAREAAATRAADASAALENATFEGAQPVAGADAVDIAPGDESVAEVDAAPLVDAASSPPSTQSTPRAATPQRMVRKVVR